MADKTPRDKFAEMRKRPVRELFGSLWEYYRWPAAWVLFAVGCLVSLVLSYVNQKDVAFYGLFLNSTPSVVADEIVVDYVNYADIDTNAYDVDINTRLYLKDTLDEEAMNTSQYILTHIAAGQIDLAVMDRRNFDGYSYAMFQDLRDYLTDEEFAALEGKILYHDNAHDEGATSYDTQGMENPVPIGVDLGACTEFIEAFRYQNSDAVAGICTNALHPELAAKFIRFILLK